MNRAISLRKQEENKISKCAVIVFMRLQTIHIQDSNIPENNCSPKILNGKAN